MKKRIRKPHTLDREMTETAVNIYAGFDEAEDCVVYIGGRYYNGSAQIHLNRAEVKDLSKWLVRAEAYLASKESK